MVCVKVLKVKHARDGHRRHKLAAALVPESFAPGDAPPATRPRLDAPHAPEPSASAVAVDVKPLFEKKLTKEEKKAAAAAKKAPRRAPRRRVLRSGSGRVRPSSSKAWEGWRWRMSDRACVN